MLGKAFSCYFKVLQKNDEEILPQESCIEDDEYNLMSRAGKEKGVKESACLNSKNNSKKCD